MVGRKSSVVRGGGLTLQRRTHLTALTRADAEVQATGGVATHQAESVARSAHYRALCSRQRVDIIGGYIDSDMRGGYIDSDVRGGYMYIHVHCNV